MGMYFGISCLRETWRGIYLDSDDGELLDEGVLELSDLDSGNIFIELEQSVRLSKCSSWRDPDICGQVAHLLGNTDVATFYKRHVYNNVAPDAVGICHPYGSSPPVRRSLSAFFASDPIRIQERKGLDEEHPDTRQDCRLCAIETPFAACLALIDEKAFALPATLVVIGPAADGLEVTVVKAVAHGSELELTVVFHREGFTGSKGDKIGIQAVVEAVTKIGCLKDGTCMIVCIHDDSEKLGETLDESMPGATRRLISERVLAAGAARYASMCAEEKHGFGFKTLRCRQFVAYPLGICGKNKEDEFFWCPISKPNQMMGENLEIELNETAAHCRLVLAEHTNPTSDPDGWGIVSDAQELRWHSQILVPNSNVDQTQILQVVVESSTGCFEYGWSDPFVQATFV